MLVLAVAFNRKSERWLDVGDAPPMDQAAADECVGVLTPDDQVSISENHSKWEQGLVLAPMRC